jgi:hypothetical protein
VSPCTERSKTEAPSVRGALPGAVLGAPEAKRVCSSSGIREGRTGLARGRGADLPRGTIPAFWTHVAEVRKAPLTWPVWSDPLPPSARAHELKTTSAEKLRILVPLEEVGGVGLEGARLRVTAWAYHREREVTATLEVPSARMVTIGRVDAWPTAPHVNTAARGVSGLRRVPPIVEGHHVHPFPLNAALGPGAFEPQQNLPLAVPVEGELRSFRDFLRTVAHEFRIDGIKDIDPPGSWRLLI